MNILVVLHSHDCGGAERHALLLMEGLLAAGHSVAFAGPLDSWLADNAKAAGICCFHVPMHGFYDFYSLFMLVRAARISQADVFHGHLARGSYYAGLAAKILGRPAIATAHSTNSHKHFTSARKIIAVSGAVREYLLNKQYPADKIALIHHGIPSPDTNGIKREKIRSELDIHGNQLALCMVARFVRDKGHDLAVEALRQLEHPNVRLFLVGKSEGAWFDAIREQAKVAELQHQVHFLGHRENVHEILGGMDIFLAPSRREALSLSILEACASGLPIIASRVGGIPEIIAHGENGLLFEIDDSESLFHQLRILVESRGIRNELSRKAHKTFVDKFSIEKMIKSTIKLYGSELKH